MRGKAQAWRVESGKELAVISSEVHAGFVTRFACDTILARECMRYTQNLKNDVVLRCVSHTTCDRDIFDDCAAQGSMYMMRPAAVRTNNADQARHKVKSWRPDSRKA